MNNVINIDNLTFSYDNKEVLKNISFDVDLGDFVSVIGPNGSGKSTLVKLLSGIYINNSITIDGKIMDSKTLSDIRRDMGVVFDNNDMQFIFDTVYDDLVFSLIGPKDEINNKINFVASELGFSHLLNKNIKNLSGGEMQLVALAGAILRNPKLLILDDAFCMMDKRNKKRALSYLLNLHNTTDITIINVTHNLEEVTISDKIVLLDGGEIKCLGYTRDVLSEEKMLKSCGLELPFSVDLSLNLKYYGLLDELVYDMNDMVVKLWP